MHDIDVEDNCAYNYNANNSDEETIMMPITLIKTTVMQNNNHADNNGEKSIREMTLMQTTVMSIKKKLPIPTPKSSSKNKIQAFTCQLFPPFAKQFCFAFRQFLNLFPSTLVLFRLLWMAT